MKTIVEISGNNYGSTGKISLNIAKIARENGFNVYTCYKNSIESNKYHYENQIYIGSWLDRVISERLAYVTSLKGCFNIINTYSFIRKINKLKPDLLHFHLLHDSFINIPMLFHYVKKKNIPVVWTMHDSWAFTGQCADHVYIGCNKWERKCGKCPNIKKYPGVLFIDITGYMWKKKKLWFSNINKMTLVTPSKWMKNNIEKSFLSSYKTIVINNGIDLAIYKYTESDFREKYNIKDKFIILGVAYEWDDLVKGRDAFVYLAKNLPNNYQIVMVGTNDEVDKKLPKNIISIHKTFNVEELVKIYSAADLFVNPTKNDNFPTVNIEALACGLPILTYDTGGSPEVVNEHCGRVVKRNDIKELEKQIIDISMNKPFSKNDCINESKKYNMNDKFKEYVDLYKKILNY